MILADKIILLRKKCGWSQEQLAEQLGISRQSVSKWESGMSIPDLEKIVKMSGLFGISTDYLLKEEIEEITPADKEEASADGESRSISVEEADIYMTVTRKLAKPISLAAAICVCSPICLILLGGFAEYGKIAISENMAGGIGIIILLVMVAIGASIFISTGMKLDKYEYFEKEKISLQYGVKGIVEKKKDEFAHTYRSSIIIGTVICILAVIPLFLAAAMEAEDLVYVCCVAVLLALVACAAALFIWSGNIQGSYEKLLQEGDYTDEKKMVRRRIAYFPAIYWCLAVALYLAISLPKNNWETSWVVWPVAGVLYAALHGILSAIVGRDKKR